MREWVPFLAPLQFIDAMGQLAPGMDRKTLFRAAVALSKPPEEWLLYTDYEPECHADEDPRSAVLLVHLCDKVYIPPGLSNSQYLRRWREKIEESNTVGRPKPIPQGEFVGAAVQWLRAAVGEDFPSLATSGAVPVARLSESRALVLLYAMGALEHRGTLLAPSRQLAFISTLVAAEATP
ncbi:MAG: hypothetical protein QXI07_09015 [Pyrobaculum sp.]